MELFVTVFTVWYTISAFIQVCFFVLFDNIEPKPPKSFGTLLFSIIVAVWGASVLDWI